MSLDLSRLENVHERGSKVIARCPACAENGRDEKGEHLVIMSDGRFGCVVYPGAAGKPHRQKIFRLAGDQTSRERRGGVIRVQRPPEARLPQPATDLDDVGRFGRISLTYARTREEDIQRKEEEEELHRGRLQRDPSNPSTSEQQVAPPPEELDEMDEINESSRRIGLPPIKPLLAHTPRDPETGFPIIDGAICPF
jgi:hypothetical protein